MDNIRLLKEKIKEQLDGGYAHTPYYKILEDFPLEHINTKPNNVNYSFWELLEHIRISHWDIVNFVENPNYKDMKWPEEYWPIKNTVATEEMWRTTVIEIKKLYEKTEKMLFDPNMDLFKKIAHGTGQHNLREFLLIAEHNAYHFGQFMSYKKMLI
jgi:hypothetical protein